MSNTPPPSQHEAPNETTRLIVPERPQSTRARDEPSVLFTILSAAAVLSIGTIGTYITVAPQLAILEDIVCHKYYAGAGVGNVVATDGCKAEPVQSEVAFITGWRDVFETVPAMLLAVPYGRLADRVGRKKVLIFAIGGCFLSDAWVRLVLWFPSFFPLRAIWFSGLWQAIGGGAVTISSLIFVLVADVCPPERRVAAFSQIHSAVLLSEFIFVPVGASLIHLSPWIPMFISSFLMIVALYVAALLVPETLSVKNVDRAEEPFPEGDEAGVGTAPKIGRRWMQRQLGNVLHVGTWIVSNGKVAVVLLSFLLFHLGEAIGGPLLLQYVSKRYGWSLAKASYLVSLRAALNLVVLALLIPTLSTYLIRRMNLDEMVKDKRIAQLSGILLLSGCSTIFIATSSVPLVAGQALLSLGWSFTVPSRSLITSMVEQHELATVYTAISVMTYGGVILGGPLLASSLQYGMKLGGFWMGVPFLVAGTSFTLATLAISVATH